MSASLLLQLLGPAAGGLLLLAAWLRRQRSMREAAERCGLTVESTRLLPFVTVMARSGPVEFRLVEGRHGVHVTATVLGARPDLAEVSIRRDWLPLPGRNEIEIGDEDFDSSFLIKGPVHFVSALLDMPARHMLRQADGEASSFAIEGNRLRAEVKTEQLGRILPLFRDLGRRFFEVTEVPQRLAENVRWDSEPGVRLHNLLLLVRDYPGYRPTDEALRIACEDASPQVRLLAALELGNEGRGVLEKLAEGLENDAVSRQAIVALGSAQSPERLRAIFSDALEQRQTESACACLEVLGTPGVLDAADAELLLLHALARDNPPLQTVAAKALGRAGSVAAVPSLQDVVESSSPRELRRAARQAIDEIQSRLAGAAPGQLSLAATEAGQLSLAQADAGQLSLAVDTAGQLTLTGEDGGESPQ